MLADWFNEPPETAVNKVEEFEKAVKKKFIDEPGQMKLLIVVDKLLTGFDAPPATYLYIDKQMRDHGLFQAICRVNRLDGDDKEYGYIIDYKDLFKSLEGAVTDYTSGALDGYDKEDVAGLLKDRLEQGPRAAGGSARGGQGAVRAGRAAARHAAYLRYFCASEPATPRNSRPTSRNGSPSTSWSPRWCAPTRTSRTRWTEAGYTGRRGAEIKREVDHYEKVRNEVKLASGDYIDLKMYEPAMRHLIDTYIRAEESEKVSAFDDLSLVQLIVERGAEAVDALPDGHPQEQGGGRRDHREQRPQADHRRVADQPEVLRADVGAARRADRAAQGGRARLQGVPGQDRRADEAGRLAQRRHEGA